MPRSGPNGTFDWNPGDASVVANTTISPGRENSVQSDVRQTFNTIQPITYGGTGVADGKPLDNTFGVKNNADPTKIGVLNASNIPTATTRTYDLPYYSGTLGLVSDIRGYIVGLTLTNDAGDLTNDIAFGTGSAVDSTGAVSILLASGLIKRLDASWAVGTNQGGLDTGAVGNNTYYCWLIRRPDTGVVDALFSLSSTAPTMPANYTQKALVGVFARVGGVNNYPRSYGQGDVTDWMGYAPTFTGFGTATGIAVFSRRVGDSLEIKGRFASGIPTAVTARMSLGFSGVNGSITIDSSKAPSTTIAGSISTNRLTAQIFTVLEVGGRGDLSFGTQTASVAGDVPQNADSIITNGLSFMIQATIPIAGWNDAP